MDDAANFMNVFRCFLFSDLLMSCNFAAGRATMTIPDVTATLTLEDVLFWLTGARLLPAVGISPIDVHFNSDLILPRVHTCTQLVTFPILPELKQGRKSVSIFARWILDSPGFGQA